MTDTIFQHIALPLFEGFFIIIKDLFFLFFFFFWNFQLSCICVHTPNPCKNNTEINVHAKFLGLTNQTFKEFKPHLVSFAQS